MIYYIERVWSLHEFDSDLGKACKRYVRNTILIIFMPSTFCSSVFFVYSILFVICSSLGGCFLFSTIVILAEIVVEGAF